MPPKRRRIDQLQDDIWGKNKTTLRRLFLDERRTLKNVKKAMESEYGFPVTPLSTYESKLRDLGLRKKMKKTDWHPVYQHYVNSGNRHTALYFNGTRIPWEKAWKEIRRSGAKESVACHATRLPVDVIMRSPSPVLDFQSVVSVSMLPVPWHLSDVSLGALSPAAVVYRSKLYEIPSNLLRIEMHNNFQQSLIRIPTKSDEASSYRNVSLGLTNPSIEPRLLDQSSTLSYQGPRDTNLISDIDRLSSVLYRLANGEVPRTLPTDWLEVIFDLTPKQVLLKILAINSPVIQAALETLLSLAAAAGRKDDFASLVQNTRRLHKEWTFNTDILIYAAKLGCINSCRTILQKMSWPDFGPSFPDLKEISIYSDVISTSVTLGHIDCAKMLFEHSVGPHTALTQTKDVSFNKVFSSFLRRLMDRHDIDWSRHPAVLTMLDWFFEVGANVDLPIEKTSSDLYYTRYTPENWMPTLLDYIYFLSPGFYSALVGYSIKSKAELTRPGIHHSARKGIDSLRSYLRSRQSHTPPKQDILVDILLVEECLRSEDSDLEVIRTLLDYSLTLQEYHSDMNASAMLYYVIDKARNQRMHPAVHHIVKTLIQSGATIVAETIERAVEIEGTTLLQLLSLHGADFKSRGALALSKAARIDNYDAVNWLLDMEIDANSPLREGWTILAYANNLGPFRKFQIFDHKCKGFIHGSRPMRCEMLEYLISRNFKLRARCTDTSPRPLLHLMLENGSSPFEFVDFRKKIKLILDTEPLVDEQPEINMCLLEACFSSKGKRIASKNLSYAVTIVNDLLDYGVSARHSGVLAPLIQHSAPSIEIQRVLDGGADTDTYYDEGSSQYTPLQAAAGAGSLDWVRFLIQRGADVNAPAKGFHGRTALQAACEVEERSSKIELLKFLIDTGADVNAPPAPRYGATAFQVAARRGDFEVALLLLDNGADINAPPPAEEGGSTALDEAVSNGKLDMVQFLLNLGALSHDMGESGYRGAIKIAEKEETPAITESIRQHALNNGKSGEELSADWDYTLSEHSSEADDADETDDAELWDQTGWEDWLP